MTSDYAYGFLRFMARKNQTADITPQEFTYSVGSAQDKFYDYLIGQLEQFKPGKPVPNVALGMNRKVSKFLLPLKVTDATVTVSGGYFSYPTDYDYLALMMDSSYRKIDILDDTKFPGRYNSTIDPVTDASTGFGRETENGWKIFPNTITSILVTYYKRPVKPVWGYTVNSDGTPHYNPATSTDPVFDDNAMEKVLAMACEELGYSFVDADLVRYGQEVKINGR